MSPGSVELCVRDGVEVRHLYVVTHTESQHHVDQLVGGWYDAGLTERGLAQAALVAQELRRLIPDGVAPPVYSSDLRRAAETADVVAAALASTVQPRSELREMSYGEAEGRPEAWLRERFVPAPVQERMDHRSGLRGAETKREVGERIYRVVDDILAGGATHQVIVTHGGALTFVVMAWAQVPVEAIGWLALRSSPGGITHLIEDDYFRNRGVAFLNKHDHLVGS